MRKSWYGVGLLLGLAFLLVSQSPGDKLKLIVCDVGQGDAILITKGTNQVLVDGGPSGEKILACLEQYVPFFDRQIELIVLTNTDYDHLNGLSSVVERYKVIEFVTADGVHESAALEKLITKLGESKVEVVAVEQGDVLRVSGNDHNRELVLKVLWPPEVRAEYVAVLSTQMQKAEREQILGASAKRGDLNERSVVLLLLEDNYRALLMGDAGFQTEKQLLLQGILEKVDYLKIGHHGSKYASSPEFLAKIQPAIAVVSAGANNRYGHPTAEALARVEAVGARVSRTDREGTIEVVLP